MWVDEEVVTLLSAWEDKRSQEQLDRMPFERKNVPLSLSIIPGTRPSVYTRISRSGPVPVAHATRLRRRARGTRVHRAYCVLCAPCKRCVPRWSRVRPEPARMCKRSLNLIAVEALVWTGLKSVWLLHCKWDFHYSCSLCQRCRGN